MQPPPRRRHCPLAGDRANQRVADLRVAVAESRAAAALGDLAELAADVLLVEHCPRRGDRVAGPSRVWNGN